MVVGSCRETGIPTLFGYYTLGELRCETKFFFM